MRHREPRADFCDRRLRQGAGAGFLRGAPSSRAVPLRLQGWDSGVKLMHEAAQEHGLLTVSEVMEIAQIELCCLHRLLPGGARNMQTSTCCASWPGAQADLAEARISATLEELLLSSEYILAGGNYDVILCERGIGLMRHPRAIRWTFRRFR